MPSTISHRPTLQPASSSNCRPLKGLRRALSAPCPPPSPPRPAARIAADVDRGLALFAQIDTARAELKAIEDRLCADALAHPGEHELLKDEARTCRQYTAAGTTHTLPIILTADRLVQSFAAGSKAAQRIRAAAGRHLSAFYTRTITHESAFDSGKIFRARAVEILGEKAPAFIAACTARDKDGLPKSDLKVEWKRTTERPKLEAAA